MFPAVSLMPSRILLVRLVPIDFQSNFSKSVFAVFLISVKAVAMFPAVSLMPSRILLVRLVPIDFQSNFSKSVFAVVWIFLNSSATLEAFSLIPCLMASTALVPIFLMASFLSSASKPSLIFLDTSLALSPAFFAAFSTAVSMLVMAVSNRLTLSSKPERSSPVKRFFIHVPNPDAAEPIPSPMP